MTAYLQPGDKIHITVPSDFASAIRGLAKIEDIVAAYASLGIEVFQATPVIHSEQVTVVAVIRESERPTRLGGTDSLIPLRYRLAEKLKLVDDLPWQDPAETTERPRGKEFLPHGLPPE